MLAGYGDCLALEIVSAVVCTRCNDNFISVPVGGVDRRADVTILSGDMQALRLSEHYGDFFVRSHCHCVVFGV